jgi:assimilatory nitrate reductase catalytic subunit
VIETDVISTTCPYCGVGCGVKAHVEDEQVIRIEGDQLHPANFGKLCVKGTSLKETQTSEGRLLQPQIDGRRTDWSSAINTVANTFKQTIEEYGPDSVAMYLSGQLLTEDYYVANKLMKGFVGSANVDTNSRLCMASAVAAHKRAFGEDIVPCNYADLDDCELVVLVGSNTAWAHPIVYQRIARLRELGKLQVVVIDPRKTATCDIADMHLALKPGSDVSLFNGLFTFLHDHGYVDQTFCRNSTAGFDAAIDNNALSVAEVALATQLESDSLYAFYKLFCAKTKTMTLYSQGVNQAVNGTDKANSIINCHLATGRIGRSGMGPFSITGQPNAMGGREVGGMANQLAAHMDFTDVDTDRVQRFWQATNMAHKPGLKAVDMFDAVHSGEIKAIWIMATNPLVSMPNTSRIREALARCPFVVVSECVENTDTSRMANVLLPAASWGEKDGTVTNSERCISRQRKLTKSVGEALPDWQIITRVAHAMGFGQAFDYKTPRDVFIEHAALSGFENAGARLFDISWLEGLSEREYDGLTPVQWPQKKRPFADLQFYHGDKKARFVSTVGDVVLQRTTNKYPFILNSGRLRDQWHTMSRTGTTHRLFQHAMLPMVQINPVDALALGADSNSLLAIQNQSGVIRALADITTDVARGQLFMPIHWNNQFAGPTVINTLFRSCTDPVSGQPESKHGAVSITLERVYEWIRIVSKEPVSPELLASLYPVLVFWVGIPNASGWQYECAFKAQGTDSLVEILKDYLPGSRTVSYVDRSSNCAVQRFYRYEKDLPCWLLFSSQQRQDLPEPAALGNQIDQSGTNKHWRRLSVLGDKDADNSAIVCTCFEVSAQKIQSAIRAGSASIQELGLKLQCGTNCGSCVPELNQLLAQVKIQAVSGQTLTPTPIGKVS